MNEARDYWQKAYRKRLTRRRLLTLATRTGLGMAGMTLLGCAAAPAPAPTTAPTRAAGAPTPTPKPAATPAPAVKPVAGGTLTIGQRAITTLDPDNTSGGRDAFQLRNLYDALTGVDPQARPIPELAVSWETPDPTTFIFKLRKGVKFHDGTDFNAQVVKINYERTRDPKTKSKSLPDLMDVSSEEVVDDYTFKFKLSRPSASFIYLGTGRQTSSGSAGYMKSPEALKKYNNDLRQHGVGTGPFEFEEWTMDVSTTLKRFAGHWRQGVPYLDKLVWKVLPDVTVAITMLKGGDTQWDNWIDLERLPIVKTDPNLVPEFHLTPGFAAFYMNMANPPFNKKAVRQAVAYAIDREALTNVVYAGMTPPGDALYPKTMWAYDPALKGYPYDLAKAKDKLKEAGLPDGFSTTTKVSSAEPEYQRAAEVIQGMLAKIGIKTNIKIVERALALTEQQSGQYETYVAGSSGSPDPHPDLVSKFRSQGSFMKDAFDPADPVVKQVDALIDKGDSTFNLEDRKAIYSQLQKLLLDEVYSKLIITYMSSRHVRRKEVMGYVQYPGRFTADYHEVWLQK